MFRAVLIIILFPNRRSRRLEGVVFFFVHKPDNKNKMSQGLPYAIKFEHPSKADECVDCASLRTFLLIGGTVCMLNVEAIN